MEATGLDGGTSCGPWELRRSTMSDWTLGWSTWDRLTIGPHITYTNSMSVKHFPPRRQTHMTRKDHNRQLALCFVASLVLMGILVLVTFAFGQEHPFPFKTLEDITTGTPAWQSGGLPNVRYCPGAKPLIAKFQLMSGAGSVWVVYIDGVLFSAAYFPPGVDFPPVTAVEGHIVDGKQVVVTVNVAYDSEKHRPCNPWLRKSAMEG